MIIKIAGLCIFAGMFSVILKQLGKGEMAMILSLSATVFVLSLIFSEVFNIVNSVKIIAERTNIDMEILKTIMKITGIAYIAQSASELCKDVGEGALSSKVELSGKILICAIAIPYVNALFAIISEFL